MALFSAQRTAVKDAFVDYGIDANVYDKELAKVQHPAIIVGWPESYDPRSVFGGGSDIVFNCRIEVVASRDFAAGDDALEEYLSLTGSNSLIAAIEADPTLGGVVMSASVAEFTNFGFRDAGDGVTVVMCIARVEVYA